jgi:hypothetical protein
MCTSSLVGTANSATGHRPCLSNAMCSKDATKNKMGLGIVRLCRTPCVVMYKCEVPESRSGVASSKPNAVYMRDSKERCPQLRCAVVQVREAAGVAVAGLKAGIQSTDCRSMSPNSPRPMLSCVAETFLLVVQTISNVAVHFSRRGSPPPSRDRVVKPSLRSSTLRSYAIRNLPK